MQGLSIIPEGRVNKECQSLGALYEVSHIINLERYLKYSSEMNLGILYLSTKRGIIYQDDIVEASPMPLYKYPYPKRILWTSIVVEQITRSCMWYTTRDVYLMINKMGCYQMLVEGLRKRGINVYLPFLDIKR